jgi:hypothetical protein
MELRNEEVVAISGPTGSAQFDDLSMMLFIVFEYILLLECHLINFCKRRELSWSYCCDRLCEIVRSGPTSGWWIA